MSGGMGNALSRRAVGRLGATAIAAATIGPVRAAPSRTVDVVVVGGGFGGATAARYLKQFAPGLSVVVVEQNKVFHTCPFSNLVLGGLRRMSDIAHGYAGLAARGVEVVHQRVLSLDPERRTVRLADDSVIGFRKAILSPGVDMRWNALSGYDEAAAQAMPHAWKAGPQTALLRQQLQAMADGDTVIIAPPDNPFRCPPGPYERASLIAHWLQQNRPRSKVLILDAKDRFSKQGLFTQAWAALYPGLIEHVPAADDGRIVAVDAVGRWLETAFGDRHSAAVINVIPPQWAGAIARDAGLVNADGWCPVGPTTFASDMAADVHVIGDAAVAGQMPKSGFSANSQGKVAAANIVQALAGRDPIAGSFANTCYSLVGPGYGISVAKVYRSTADGIVGIDGSGGLSPMDANADVRAHEAAFAEGWYASITADMFG
ncbi:MAG: FCSD flavin-binding domain-containing protein [Minwuia sp.]|nr:FCSD flavin-binding domain-containing protein [Minwuia sp.]